MITITVEGPQQINHYVFPYSTEMVNFYWAINKDSFMESIFAQADVFV